MDIVERLRNFKTTDVDLLFLKNDAALEIERLLWENSNMEKLWGKSEATWMEIRDKQDAEIEQLREALKAAKDCIEDKSYIDAEMVIDNALQQKDSE